jgi:hypothetical protein
LHLRNIASWRVKETDRITAMATELRKLGALVEEGDDHIAVSPAPTLTAGAAIDTYDDHRMAMCFSLAALGGVPVTINDPACVNKTFPDYFDAFAEIAAPVIAIDGPSASGKGTVAERVAAALGYHYLDSGSCIGLRRWLACAPARRWMTRRGWRSWRQACRRAFRRSHLSERGRRNRRHPDRGNLGRRLESRGPAGGPGCSAVPPAGLPTLPRAGRRRPRYGFRGIPRSGGQGVFDGLRRGACRKTL